MVVLRKCMYSRRRSSALLHQGALCSDYKVLHGVPTGDKDALEESRRDNQSNIPQTLHTSSPSQELSSEESELRALSKAVAPLQRGKPRVRFLLRIMFHDTRGTLPRAHP